MLCSCVLTGVTFLLTRWCTTSPGLLVLQLHATPKVTLELGGPHLKEMDMESDKSTLTCSKMFCHTSEIKWCILLNSLVMFGPSHLFSHIGFNQSKPILLPSNIDAITHRKNCSTSSNSIESFFLNVSTEVLNMARAAICLFRDASSFSYRSLKK